MVTSVRSHVDEMKRLSEGSPTLGDLLTQFLEQDVPPTRATPFPPSPRATTPAPAPAIEPPSTELESDEVDEDPEQVIAALSMQLEAYLAQTPAQTAGDEGKGDIEAADKGSHPS
jgi:hypothetical protein